MIASIPADISYGLQCSEECFDITSDVMTYYYRFNEIPLAPIVDAWSEECRDHYKRGTGEGLRSLSRLYARQYNHWFWNKAEHDERVWCVAAAFDGFGQKTSEFINYLFHKFVTDTLSNGGDPSSRESQQKWLDASRQMSHGSKLCGQLVQKIKSVNVSELREAIQHPAQFNDRLRPVVYYNSLIGDDRNLNSKIKTNPVKQRKQRLSVLKKSALFLSRLIGRQNVSMFVSGQEILVEGNKFIFSVQKGSASSEVHGALKISVLDKTTQIHLFDVCWYVDATPILDQLSALIMAVKIGDEDEILKIGNLFKVNYDVFETHGHLRSVLPDNRQNSVTRPKIDFNVPDSPLQMLSIYPKDTEDYIASHPDVYFGFFKRCSKRLMVGKFPQEIENYYTPHVKKDNLLPPRPVLPPPIFLAAA